MGRSCFFLLIAVAALHPSPPRSFAAEPQRDDSTSGNASRDGDPILFVKPWSRRLFANQRGKVLLPERTDSTEKDNATDGAPGEAPFLGPQACAECHRDKFEGFLHTSHFQTSKIADADTLMGSYQVPRNKLVTRESQLHFRMDARPEGHYQTAVVGDRDIHSERMDLVLGSGKVGQSYLYWRGEELFQLPVSYFTPRDAWMNSPGYPDGTASFARPIVGRCLACHATWFEAESQEKLNHRYATEGFMLGVSCERCHGPGGEHIAHHRAHPDDQQAQHVVHPGKLPRARLFDICGQCHGGIGRLLRPAFSFRPGKVLAHYVDPGKPTGKPGLHSNDQLQRLRKSQCFQRSPRLSCATCHDPHRFERGDHALFAKRCQQCHEVADCALQPEIGDELGNHCAQCHMSRAPLVDIGLKSRAGVVFPEMIDHHIRTGVSDRKLADKLRAASVTSDE